MHNLIGIDQSLSSTGIAVLDGDGRSKHLTRIKTKTDQFETEIERMVYIKKSIYDICIQFNVTQAIMEGFSYCSKGNRTYQVGGMGYIIRELFFERNIPYKIIAPRELKKFVAGSGNADKSSIIEAVNKRWGQSLRNPRDNDIADAYALAMMGIEILNNNGG
jgi:Holliday junction resolvasome RuvABC endonuclease subunit